MEDLAEKLNGILSSPEGQEQLKNIAAMFGGSDAPDLSGLFGQGASSSAPTENSAQDPSRRIPAYRYGGDCRNSKDGQKYEYKRQKHAAFAGTQAAFQ